jgi:hypothetical protein
MGFLVLLIINLIKIYKTRGERGFVYNPSRSRLAESGPGATGSGEITQDARSGQNTKHTKHTKHTKIPPYQNTTIPRTFVKNNFCASENPDSPDLRKSSAAPTSEILGMVVFWYDIFYFFNLIFF